MAATATKGKRPVEIEDLLSLKFVKGASISPDGTLCAFPVQTVRKDRKGYRSHLYVAATDGSSVRQYTSGKKSDGAPVFSPDGRWIAFTSKRGDHPGIHLIPTDGGEARTLVEKDGSFSSVSFSPDGKRILCSFRANDPPEKSDDSSTNDAGAADKNEPPVYRHVTRLFYRLDGEGFLPKDGFHVWTFDIETGEGKQLTRSGARREELHPSYSPDGRWIAYVTNRRPDPDLEPDQSELMVIPAKGGKARVVRTPAGVVAQPRFSPDGKTIAYLGHADTDDPWYEIIRVWTVPFRGGQAKCLCPRFDRQAMDDTISDSSVGFFEMAPAWSADGKSIVFLSAGDGSTGLYRVSARGGTPRLITATRQHIQCASVSASGRVASAVIATATKPAEIHTVDLRTGDQEAITELNRDWLRRVQLQKPERVRYPSTDGAKVEAWILKPPRFNPRRRYPAIVQVHGGPMAQYGYSFFHELQLMAARGYVVFYANPRGSSGYGRKWAEAIKEDWGGADWDDVSAGTDYLAALPYVNDQRIGITGGSYGGFMTNWAVGHTNRYRAAVTQRSVVDMTPFFGSSDVGYLFHYELGGYPWENREGYAAQSPLTFVKKIRTPLLIIHSESDLRCNIEQAENLFAALKVLKRTTEMVRFPGEPHGLSRGGRPDRRVVRLEKILDWFERYL